jgi:predicted RNA-binding protein
MAYFINLFSPQTYETFSKSDQSISGFRIRQKNMAKHVQPGDKLVCYMTKLSRWVGVLEVISESFEDNTPIFFSQDDPFVVRFKVRPLVWLPKEKAVPIQEDNIWKTLTFTRGVPKKSSIWTGKIRNSLNSLDEKDGEFLEQLLNSQIQNGHVYEVDETEYQRHIRHKVRRPDGEVTVSVPTDGDEDSEIQPRETRESIKIQAHLAKIGDQMGLRIWIPRNDRAAVQGELITEHRPFLENLPLNYDETTIKTIEQIDVLWLRGRSIVRAFEVEHTTSIYSGILRMADLLALQPNMNIKLHIVAPYERRDKVFQEIQRPVFSLLDEGPLSDRCSFLSYDSVKELAGAKHLTHMSDSVLDEYAEEAE